MSNQTGREKKIAHNNDRKVESTKGLGIHGEQKKSIAKKGGAGGKGTWGKPGLDDLNYVEVMGKGDPNYDDYEDQGSRLAIYEVATQESIESLAHEKEAIFDIIQEYIGSDGDMAEAIELLETNKEIEGNVFVEQAITFGVEHDSYERELISRLLPEAHRVFDEGKGFAEGFQAVLYALPDLQLDNPNAEVDVGLFIARAIYDDALPPGFIKNAVVDNDNANHAVTLAYNTINNQVERNRLDHVWGTTAFRSVEELGKEVDNILREYLSAATLSETENALRELKCPSYMSQVVKQALFLALESNSKQVNEQILQLLKNFLDAGLIGDTYMRTGFKLAFDGLAPILLDLPKNAKETLVSLFEKAKEMGVCSVTNARAQE